MHVRISFGPVSDAFLRQQYGDRLTHKVSDKLSLFIFSQFRKPSFKEILKDDPNGIQVMIPYDFVHRSRIYISPSSKELIERMIILYLKEKLEAELTITLQRRGELKIAILSFMERYNLTEVTDYDMWKKHYFRARVRLEKFGGVLSPSVPKCPPTQISQ